MNWIDAAPITVMTVGWAIVPGLVISYLMGLRGIAAWGFAPVTSVALITSTAVLAELIGVDWSVGIVLVGCAAVAVVVGVGAFLLRRKAFLASDPDPRRLTLVAALGMLPALVLGLATIVRSVGAPDTLSQTYDAVFHYNALAHIADSHQASSLTLGALGNPDVPGVFYPAAWHDLASLVMMSTGTGIPTAANAVTVVASVILWPLSCLLLVRQLFGRSPGALAIAATVSVGFTAFPWDLLGFGVLWPNLLGMALAPACFAVVLTLTGWVRDDAIGRGRGWPALLVALVAAGFAHPNVLFSIAVLSIFPIAARLGVRAWRLHRQGRTIRGGTEVLLFLVFLGGAWYWSASTPVLENTRSQYWPPFETPAGAVGDVLLNSTNAHEALWLLSVVVVLGIVASLRSPALRLIVAGHLVTAFLYVLTAAVNRPDTIKFTGYWYNDSHRLAAMLPITGVPLAVGGILFLAKKIVERVPATADAPGWRQRPARAPGIASAGIVTVVLALVLVVATGGLYPDERYDRVAIGYHPPKPAVLVTRDMERFYARIADEIPEDSIVAGNPFEGSAMLWALVDREVLFPHFRGTYSAEQAYLAGHLDDIARDPKVCAAVDDLHVDYLLVGGVKFRKNDTQWDYFNGLRDPAGSRGFELVDSSGPSKLYKITACDEKDGGTQPAG
ncbi:MAG: hypothetical protein GEV28_22600 [Actinophytocola sp.]|uniref:DUF6541 family protein n=1 Tax=Actinophytocola sp. TaxID=1872138 RepID=UPI0013279490|nr:DUF6541 family protein [Actinophytocola sp.]MPZ83028.1 hypothetical protein [Actinophytocola sp.]